MTRVGDRADERANEPVESLVARARAPHRVSPGDRAARAAAVVRRRPDLSGTPLILEELDRRGLKAIFFVTGWRLTGRRPEDIARRDLVRKIAAHGHLVANHTMSHHDLCQNPTEQAAEIDGNTELITQTTGVRPLLFRSPYGAFCHSLEASLAARELPDIGWNIDPAGLEERQRGRRLRLPDQQDHAALTGAGSC